MTDPDPLADLAVRLEELSGQVADQFGQWARSQSEIGVLRERQEGTAGQVMLLLAEIKQMREELAEAIEKRQLKPPPAPWWGVDQEQGEAMLADLRGWVGGFLARHYPGYVMRLPSCWWRHMEAVWELSALRTEHERIFADPQAGDLQGLLAFHDRWFPGCLARLAAALADCKDAPCRLSRPP
jgi:hypothetical protein